MEITKKLILLLVIVFAVLVSLEKIYDLGLSHNANLKAANCSLGTRKVDLLIHGPCEPLWMIAPSRLDPLTGHSSYNLALSHSDFADNYLHLYLYLKHNPAPRVMLLYVTPESMDPAYNTFNTYRFAPYLGDPVIDSTVAECDPGYYRYTGIPFMKYGYYNGRLTFEVVQGLKHMAEGRTKAYFADGFEPPVQVVWDNHLEEFMRLYPEGYDFRWDPIREKYLRKTIMLAQAHGMEVYLYESPVLEESVGWTPNREKIVGAIRALAADYGIKYVQFSGMGIAASRKYYMSPLNTNNEGSAIFTDSLASFLKKEVFK